MVIKAHNFTLASKIAVASIVALVLLLLLVGCSSDTSGPVSDQPTPVASLVGHSDCIFLESLAPTDDCLEYERMRDGTLRIRHLGAGFNCCPGEIEADITITGDQILIVERETDSACRCLCLYTVDYEVADPASGRYEVRVVEPYVTEEDEPLVCVIDLSVSPSGRCCVERTHYPWQ